MECLFTFNKSIADGRRPDVDCRNHSYGEISGTVDVQMDGRWASRLQIVRHFDEQIFRRPGSRLGSVRNDDDIDVTWQTV